MATKTMPAKKPEKKPANQILDIPVKDIKKFFKTIGVRKAVDLDCLETYADDLMTESREKSLAKAIETAMDWNYGLEELETKWESIRSQCRNIEDASVEIDSITHGG